MHYAIVVEDCGREFAQRSGVIVLPNDRSLASAFILNLVRLNVLHAAHELRQVGIKVGMPGLQDTNCALGGSRSCRNLLCSALMSTRAILASARSLSAIAGTWGICRRALGAHARRRHKARGAVTGFSIIRGAAGRGEAGISFLIAVRRGTVR